MCGGNGPHSGAIQLGISLNLQQELLKNKSTLKCPGWMQTADISAGCKLGGEVTLGVGRTVLAGLLFGEQHQWHYRG